MKEKKNLTFSYYSMDINISFHVRTAVVYPEDIF